MTLGPSRTALVRLGVLSLMLAAASAVWELLAAQAPDTPLAIDMLPGPITALRELATTIGVLLIVAAKLLPWAFPEREPKRFVAILRAGALLTLAAEIYGAAHGMFGIQLSSIRPDALPLFVVKHLGLLLFCAPLLELGRRVLLRPPPG